LVGKIKEWKEKMDGYICEVCNGSGIIYQQELLDDGWTKLMTMPCPSCQEEIIEGEIN
jgi:hypothetical protein